MAYRYYDKNELGNILGTSGEDFHRNIKKLIKLDFKMELIGISVTNPDIWLDTGTHLMRLVDPDNSSNFYDTNLDFRSYK